MIFLLVLISSTPLIFYYVNSSRKEKKIKEEYLSYLLKITNEVKNPLSVCKGYMEIIEKRDNYDKKFIKIIEKEVDESIKILDEYLENGKCNVNLEYMDIGLLVDEVYEEYRSVLINDDINIYLNEEKIDNELIIKGDYIKLKKVLRNVIKNCIESKIDNKKLNINIYLKIKNNKITLIIKDNNTGKINIKKYGRYYYMMKKTKNGKDVLFSKNVINLHKGKIDYINKKEGTTVKIKLPLVKV